MSYCQCSVCGKEFGSLAGFDKHRVGKFIMPDTRRCLTEKELIEKGLHKSDKEVWKLSGAYPSTLAT